MIGKLALFPVPFETFLPQRVIKTKADSLQHPRIPAGVCRVVLPFSRKSPSRNGSPAAGWPYLLAGGEGFILKRVEEAGRDVRPRLAHDVCDDVSWVLSAYPVRRRQA